MNNKMARITVLIFGIVLFIASGIGMNRYRTGTHTTAVITAVSNVREMYSSNRNPLYRDYYEEDVTVTYNDDKEVSSLQELAIHETCTAENIAKTGNLIIKERFKRQLPTVGDTIPVFISKSGKVTEETTEHFARLIFMIFMGFFLIILGIENKERDIYEENTDKAD